MRILTSGLVSCLVACANDDSNNTSIDANPFNLGDPQTPPVGADAIEAWLARGDYKTWACEAAVHAARSPGPHGFNRICSNDLISVNAGASVDWPEGSAAVKELYATIDGTSPKGFAVYLKQAPDSNGGSNWYWYEQSGGVVFADGTGDAGSPKEVCVGCHAGAGIDAAHTPSPGARDLVYSPIPR
jgi:hypothetical protein